MVDDDPSPIDPPDPSFNSGSEQLEQEIKRLVEKQFRIKFEEIEFQFQRLMEQKIEEIEKRSTQMMQWSQMGLAEHFKEERQKMMEALRKEMEGIGQKIIQEFQTAKKILPVEAVQESPKPSPENFQAKPPTVLEQQVNPPEKQEAVFDDETEKKVRAVYEQLIVQGGFVFDQIADSKTPDLGPLTVVLQKVIEIVLESNSEWTYMVFEPYLQEQQPLLYHSVNCAILAILLGLEFKLEQEPLTELALAAFLHDTGLIGRDGGMDYFYPVPEKVSPEMLDHAERGAEILNSCASETVLTAIREHHEMSNGKGYPAGLKSPDIHLYAKIIQIVDAFEALTHDRPQRDRPLTPAEAIRECTIKDRNFYDPIIIKALMKRLGVYPVTSLVELSSHKIASVIRQNMGHPLSPMVMVKFDDQGNKLDEPFIFNLAESPLLHIVGGVFGMSSSQEKIEKIYIETKPSKARRYKKKTFRWKTFFLDRLIPAILTMAALIFLARLIVKL